MFDVACRIGLCSFYDNGSGVFGMIGGVVLAAVVIILLVQRGSKDRKDDR